ncbi:MAG: hypothetical protein IJF08_07200, partial [Clostridia bacterium]|nr:hypothetical protein [Clostridia bacterium]
MKVWLEPFQRLSGQGQRRRAGTCSRSTKQKGSYFTKVTPLCFNIEIILSVLFCASRRKRRNICYANYLLRKLKRRFRMFRLCGGDKGAALDLRAFEKARPKLSSCES